MKKFFLSALALALFATESQACWFLCGPRRTCNPCVQTQVVPQQRIVYSSTPYYTPAVITTCNNGTCQPVRQVIQTIGQVVPCTNGRCPAPQR